MFPNHPGTSTVRKFSGGKENIAANANGTPPCRVPSLEAFSPVQSCTTVMVTAATPMTAIARIVCLQCEACRMRSEP
jgi:hypothetical protein